MLKPAFERRRSDRHQIDRFAKIQGRAGSLPRDCMIINISDSGVRLYTEHAEVPDEFIIIVSGVQHGRRECRVIWRLGFEIGAEFTDIRHGFAHAVMTTRG